jgi:hypothetical protein
MADASNQTCPACQRPLTPEDMAGDKCPHCGAAFQPPGADAEPPQADTITVNKVGIVGLALAFIAWVLCAVDIILWRFSAMLGAKDSSLTTVVLLLLLCGMLLSIAGLICSILGMSHRYVKRVPAMAGLIFSIVYLWYVCVSCICTVA